MSFRAIDRAITIQWKGSVCVCDRCGAEAFGEPVRLHRPFGIEPWHEEQPQHPENWTYVFIADGKGSRHYCQTCSPIVAAMLAQKAT